MGLWSVCLLLGAAALVVEPPPITYEETVDEVAQAQKRARWMACLFYIRFQYTPQILDLLLSKSKFPKAATNLRFKADILVSCLHHITIPMAEKFLSTRETYTDQERLIMETFMSVSTDLFQQEDSDISLTTEQKELLSEMDAVGGM